MFTGIVTAVGRIAQTTRDGGRRTGDRGVALTIRAPWRGLKKGESIAVNGACLTVERVARGGFTVYAVPATLGRTLLGEYEPGRPVNLERAVRAGDRLGGHFVQGHVDGVGEVAHVQGDGDAWLLDVRLPATVRPLAVPQGSLALDGVSLTIVALPAPDVARVALVPYTRAHTTLGRLAVGDRVHVEGDILAKYVKALCRSEP